jgi:mannose-6-phosphate isomerase-like protein (cupin superfamily)
MHIPSIALVVSAVAATTMSTHAYEPIMTTPDQLVVIHPDTADDIVLATGEQTDGQFGMIILGGVTGDGPGDDIGHSTSGETFYVLEGQFRFNVGDKVIEGGPGTFVSVPPKTRHGIKWLSDGRVLVTYSPPGYEHFFMEWAKRGIRPGPDLGKLETEFGLMRMPK